MSALDATTADRLLDPLVRMLARDGYAMTSRVHDDRLVVVIEPTPTACAECLLPKPVLERIVRDVLAREVSVDGISVEVETPGSPAPSA